MTFEKTIQVRATESHPVFNIPIVQKILLPSKRVAIVGCRSMWSLHVVARQHVGLPYPRIPYAQGSYRPLPKDNSIFHGMSLSTLRNSSPALMRCVICVRPSCASFHAQPGHDVSWKKNLRRHLTLIVFFQELCWCGHAINLHRAPVIQFEPRGGFSGSGCLQFRSVNGGQVCFTMVDYLL